MIPARSGLTGGGMPLASVSVGSPPSDGIPSGTTILTGDGALPVEFLAAGDRIITRDAGMVRLAKLHSGIVTLPAVSVTPGALGHITGRCPLVLPSAQPVLVRDWRASALTGRKEAVLPVSALIDGEFIRDLGPRRMVLHQLQFDMPHVYYAGGVEALGAEVEAAPSDAA